MVKLALEYRVRVRRGGKLIIFLQKCIWLFTDRGTAKLSNIAIMSQRAPTTCKWAGLFQNIRIQNPPKISYKFFFEPFLTKTKIEAARPGMILKTGVFLANNFYYYIYFRISLNNIDFKSLLKEFFANFYVN